MHCGGTVTDVTPRVLPSPPGRSRPVRATPRNAFRCRLTLHGIIDAGLVWLGCWVVLRPDYWANLDAFNQI